MTSETETQSISQQYDLPFSPAKVWRALTEPALLARWLMTTDMEPTLGNSFTFRSEPTQWWDGVVHCEILELERERRLSYTWRSGPESSPLDTVVTWTLTPTPSGGTRLDLEHSGFVAGNKFAYNGARSGWDQKVRQGLHDVLKTL